MFTDQSRTKLHYIIHYLQPADPHCFNKLRSLRLARAPSSSSNILRSLYTVLWESMMISHVISRNCYVSARPCPTPPSPRPWGIHTVQPAVYVSRVQCQRHAIVRCHPDVTNIKMAVENRRSVSNGARSSPYSEIATECKCTVKI